MMYLISFLILMTASCQNGAEAGQNLHPSKSTNPISQDTIPVDLNFLMGKFDPKSHPSFVLIPAQYGNREGMYLQKEVFEAFLQMYQAAKKDSVNLVIVSATRNFEAQKSIWENKWNNLLKDENISKQKDKDLIIAKKILEYSSMPGTSRHHWGTDLDFNALNNEWFEKNEGKKLYDWLIKNGPGYGFHLVYSKKGTERPTGYNEEKWHYTYKPLSQKYTAQARQFLNDSDITGFTGAHTATQLKIVHNYVLGIHPACY